MPDNDGLSGYEAAFLDCRDLRHRWDLEGFWADGGYLKRRMTCTNCGTERVDTWTASGAGRKSNRYHYPAGYLVRDNREIVKPVNVRREVVRRARIYATEQQMLTGVMRRRG